MRYTKLIYAAVIGALVTQTAGAIPTAEEAAQLGKTLTPVGAIKAGNKEGTIPEWTGGLCKPPANYKPKRGLEVGGAPYVDPYADDQPLFSITAANMDKYANKLTEGAKHFFKAFPGTWRMEVYPTRRSACFPDFVYENTIKKVMNPKIVGGNVPSVENAHAQFPFPIPKTGVEALWNQALRYEPPNTHYPIDQWMADASGNIIHTSYMDSDNQNLYWDNTLTSLPVDTPFWALITKTTWPPNQAGTMQMRHYYLRPDLKGAPSWSYTAGQRRVRLAPEFSYDGVSVTSGGIMLFDEIGGFDGKMDRFDFKLLGRQEMYVPYNSGKLAVGSAKAMMGPKHVNPEYLRWELHRVWKVEGILKSGERHVEQRKVFYLDEDSWNTVAYEGYDQANKVYHILFIPGLQIYWEKQYRDRILYLYDATKSAYLLMNKEEGEQFDIPQPLYGNYLVKPYPKNYFTPDAMQGMGIR